MQSSIYICVVGLLLYCSGCGPSLREQALADYDRQIRSFKTIGVLSPDILMLELTAGGTQELIDEWQAAAVQTVTRAVSKELKERQMNMKVIAHGQDSELLEIGYLNRAINESMNWNTTYRKLSTCEDERVCRDYAVGPVENILRKHNVDALLLVYGVNERETAGRAAARRKSRMASRLFGMASPVTFAPLRNPGTYLGMALVDRMGNVVWYSGTGSGRGFDLRDQAVVDKLTNRLISRMLIGERE